RRPSATSRSSTATRAAAAASSTATTPASATRSSTSTAASARAGRRPTRSRATARRRSRSCCPSATRASGASSTSPRRAPSKPELAALSSGSAGARYDATSPLAGSLRRLLHRVDDVLELLLVGLELRLLDEGEQDDVLPVLPRVDPEAHLDG